MRPLDREEEAMCPHDQSISPYLRRPLRSYEEVLRDRRARVSALAGSIDRLSDTERLPGMGREALGKGSSIHVGKP